MFALAICHNVTPVVEEEDVEKEGKEEEEERVQGVDEEREVVLFSRDNLLRRKQISYQASSPDEVTNADTVVVLHAVVLFIVLDCSCHMD